MNLRITAFAHTVVRNLRLGRPSARNAGASDADGWSEEVDVGGEDFDYDAYVANNFSESRASTEVKTEWRWVAIGMLLMFLLACLAALG